VCRSIIHKRIVAFCFVFYKFSIRPVQQSLFRSACFDSEAHASIPKRMLRFPGHQISWVSELSDLVCDFSAWASSAMEVAKKTKFSTKVA